jgi:septal ring factor EnvC (AmiA/AmiB activator)
VTRGVGDKRVVSQGRPESWAAAAAVLALAALVFAPSPAGAERAKARPQKEAKAASAAVSQDLNALIEAQRSLAADISQLRDQLNAVQQNVGEGYDEVRQNRDVLQATLEQIKGMREEVRGLYVESSGLKSDIAQLGKQVEGLDRSLGNFRLSSGIVVAVVIVLQVVLVGLMFRGRG